MGTSGLEPSGWILSHGLCRHNLPQGERSPGNTVSVVTRAVRVRPVERSPKRTRRAFYPASHPDEPRDQLRARLEPAAGRALLGRDEAVRVDPEAADVDHDAVTVDLDEAALSEAAQRLGHVGVCDSPAGALVSPQQVEAAGADRLVVRESSQVGRVDRAADRSPGHAEPEAGEERDADDHDRREEPLVS
jgi:hypothetical protein